MVLDWAGEQYMTWLFFKQESNILHDSGGEHSVSYKRLLGKRNWLCCMVLSAFCFMATICKTKLSYVRTCTWDSLGHTQTLCVGNVLTGTCEW